MIEDQYHNKQWGVHDFKRYHSQQMSNAERHALEKAALDDPFLEDALDGYAFASTPVEDLATLKARLVLQKEVANVVPFKASRTNQFLKIAAILLVFAGLTWLLYPVTQEPSTQLATTTTSAVKETILPDSAPAVAVISPNDQLKTADETLATVTPDKSPKPLPAVVEQQATGLAQADERSKKELAAMAVEEKQAIARQERAAQPVLQKTNKDNLLSNNTIEGRVVDNQGAPIPYATVTVPESNINVASDVNGMFSLKNNQQANVLAKINATGFEAANADLNAGAEENKIVLQESQQALSEIVVTGYGSNKKKSVSDATDRWKAGNANRLRLKNVTGFRNDKNFADSLNQLSANLIVTDTTGTVVLTFDVDAAGKATNIVVSKSLGVSCDSSSVQLLKKTPPLKRLNKNKATAIILF